MIRKTWVYDCNTKEGKFEDIDDPNYPPPDPIVKDIKAEYAAASNKLQYIAKTLGLE